MAGYEIEMKNKVLLDEISDTLTDMSDKFEVESLETLYLYRIICKKQLNPE